MLSMTTAELESSCHFGFSFSLYVIDEKSNGFSIEDISDVVVKASKVNGEKCQRCWKYEAKLINDEVCNRCNTVIFK